MAVIVDTIKNITYMIILVSFLKQVLPKKKNESYLKYYAGVIIILTLAMPVMEIISGYDSADLINSINGIMEYNDFFDKKELDRILNENEEKAKKVYEDYMSGMEISDSDTEESDIEKSETIRIEEISIGE